VKVRRQRIAVREAATIDLTAFLSLMVILVPFLLVTAVFTQTTILEIQPQRSEGSEHSASDPLQLQVVLRQEVIEVNYLALARPIWIDRTADGEAVVSLAALAADLKARYPGSLEATLLVEPQISYDAVVQVLDALRVRLPGLEQGDGQELFPLIALGPAALAAQAGQPGL
jgi:biopolymer transport protein ExbD